MRLILVHIVPFLREPRNYIFIKIEISSDKHSLALLLCEKTTTNVHNDERIVSTAKISQYFIWTIYKS